MKPHEVGFDGAEGLSLHSIPGGRYLLLRSKVPPVKPVTAKNELIWWYPDEEDPKLIYVDHNGKFYELDFHPIEPPWNRND